VTLSTFGGSKGHHPAGMMAFRIFGRFQNDLRS
jgi:hypothetical protein